MLQDTENENERLGCHYDRWFVVQSVDTGHPISKLSPFILDKAIRSAVGAVKKVRPLRNGDFILEVTSAVQSRIVSKLDNLAGCPVTASPHMTLNTCKVVIRCAPLVDCDNDQTLAQFMYTLTSRGPKDMRYLPFSLPLQAQPPNMQLKLLHTNSQATPLVVHKPLANGSPVRVLPLLHQATKTILISLTASPRYGEKEA